ncbi:MAG: IucA/IucC family C-terminal-domain containing protein, partial [Stackebrandtia sp.]
LLPGDHIAIPLAALASGDPQTHRPLVADVIEASGLDAKAWWRACLRALVPPLVSLAGRGIGLEAHGQNTLLVVADGRPTGAVYRDFGGVRLHHDALAALGIDTVEGDIATDDHETVHTKLIAAGFSVALAQLVDALTRAYPGRSADWWRAVADTAAAASADHPELRSRLFAATWPIKATTAMRLSDDPTADQWATVPNPIGGLP